MSGDAARNPGNGAATHNARGQVVFKALEIAPSPTGSSYTGLFVFRNNSRRAISLPGAEGPRANTFTARHVGFEVRDNEKWTNLDVGYCGIPKEFSVAPKTKCLVAIDLYAFKERDTSVVGRICVGGYTSESFTLDWAVDRSKGRFRLARKEYVEKTRKLLRAAGFRASLTNDEDFCRRLLGAILSPTDSNDLGFVPFRGDLDVAPAQASGGNLRFDFHGSVIIDYQYQYSVMLVVNPLTFSPEWYRASVSKHAAVGTWGAARTLTFDDGSGFYTDANKLYLEIKYHPTPGKTLPNEEASKKLLSRMLSKLGDCLEASPG